MQLPGFELAIDRLRPLLLNRQFTSFIRDEQHLRACLNESVILTFSTGIVSVTQIPVRMLTTQFTHIERLSLKFERNWRTASSDRSSLRKSRGSHLAISHSRSAPRPPSTAADKAMVLALLPDAMVIGPVGQQQTGLGWQPALGVQDPRKEEVEGSAVARNTV